MSPATFRAIEHSARTLFAHIDEIGLAGHLHKNMATYLRRPSDEAIASTVETFKKFNLPLGQNEMKSIVRVPSIEKRDQLIAFATKNGWHNTVSGLLSVLNSLAAGETQHAVFDPKHRVFLDFIQNDPGGIQTAGNITMAIGAIIAGAGAVLGICGLAIATPFMLVGGVVAGVGALTWGVGYYIYSEITYPTFEVQY